MIILIHPPEFCCNSKLSKMFYGMMPLGHSPKKTAIPQCKFDGSAGENFMELFCD